VPVRSLDPGLVEFSRAGLFGRARRCASRIACDGDLVPPCAGEVFPRFPGLLEKLDRVEMLQRTIVDAKASLQARGTADIDEGVSSASSSGGADRLGLMISGVYAAQRSVVMERRLDLARSMPVRWRAQAGRKRSAKRTNCCRWEMCSKVATGKPR